jgi:hypothetical protein
MVLGVGMDTRMASVGGSAKGWTASAAVFSH